MSKILTANDTVLALNNQALNYDNAPPNVAETNLVLKGNGSGDAVAATPSVDYVIPSDLSAYIPLTQKAAANGVATLNANGKVPATQLNVFVISSTAPSDTTVLWIDSNSVMRYYSNNAWHPIVPTWG